MMRHYLADDGWSRAASAMVGDRETDLQFAANMGVRGFRVGPQGRDLGCHWRISCSMRRA
jgi:imidazoleglycerol-phosphate dehydratase/histidinol-phosphatase